ncbi:hypothetical protein XAC2852_470299 [Xanthomonas citri pv. citri]|nr:hypothetical protein XAC2852_470299 [Xanthomonas citri pv. citri]
MKCTQSFDQGMSTAAGVIARPSWWPRLACLVLQLRVGWGDPAAVAAVGARLGATGFIGECLSRPGALLRVAVDCRVHSAAQAFQLGLQCGHLRLQRGIFVFQFGDAALQGLDVAAFGSATFGFVGLGLALGVAHTLGGLFELGLAGLRGGALFVLGQRGHRSGGADRNLARLDRLHHFRRGLLMDAFDHHHLVAAQARFACQLGTAHRAGAFFPRRAVVVVSGVCAALVQASVGLVVGHGRRFGSGVGVALAALARGQDLALAQRQYATLEVGHAAPAQVLFDHPQVHVLHGLEARVLHRLERQAVLLADTVAVVAIHQHIAPQHQRIAAPFGQQAAFQRLVFVGRQRVDIGLEFFFDNDVHTATAGVRGGHCSEPAPALRA